jgi:uncharacterized membrane protein YgcG
MSSSGSFPTFTPASTDISQHLWSWNPAKAFTDAYTQQKLLSVEKDKAARDQKRLDLEAAVSNALMPLKMKQAQATLDNTLADIAGKNQLMEYKAGQIREALKTQNGPPDLDEFGEPPRFCGGGGGSGGSGGSGGRGGRGGSGGSAFGSIPLTSALNPTTPK